LARLVNSYLDKIEIAKLKIGQDADKILEAINIDALVQNPETYLQGLGKAFLDEHSKDIEYGYKQGEKFAKEVMKKS
tara:strand:+ start:1791 stop:2021 length:231 start_codon:yes stop_codon:yes gene_type:complete